MSPGASGTALPDPAQAEQDQLQKTKGKKSRKPTTYPQGVASYSTHKRRVNFLNTAVITETLAVHAGYSPDPTTKAVAVPIYQTTSYAFDNTQHGADLFDLKVQGNIYTRIMNPTRMCWKAHRGAGRRHRPRRWPRAGGDHLRHPDHRRSRRQHRLGLDALRRHLQPVRHTLPQYGITVRFADYSNPETFAALIDAKTKAIYCESVGNPLGNITDFEKLAEIAHAHGIPLIVDNTVPRPTCAALRARRGHRRAFADQVRRRPRQPRSAASSSIAASSRGPSTRSEVPPPERAGCVVPRRRYTDRPRPAAFIGRARVVPLRNMGAAISPMNAFLILQGLETLALRMDRICANTSKIAWFLKDHPKVSWVSYAGLPEHPDNHLVEKYMGGARRGSSPSASRAAVVSRPAAASRMR